MADGFVYKVCRRDEWDRAERAGFYAGSAVDLRDGFIHFSTRQQVQATVAKHFSGQRDLLLLAVEVAQLPMSQLRYEPAREGALFPHLYSELPVAAVTNSWALPLRAGEHIFPAGF